MFEPPDLKVPVQGLLQALIQDPAWQEMNNMNHGEIKTAQDKT